MNRFFYGIPALLVLLFITTDSYAMQFAPFSPCKTAGVDLYVKKFKDTKKNEINFLNDEKGCVVEIKSANSGSMLVRKVALESEKYRFINFEFKVTNIIKGADLTKKKGDDAPARLYVFFEYDEEKAGFFEKAYRKYSGNKADGKAIVYIFGSSVKKGAVIENPYSDLFIQIVVESGEENVGKYVSHRRNVYEDFKKHFKDDPPKTISSIAIMTDTDNTGGSATGYFREIYLSEE